MYPFKTQNFKRAVSIATVSVLCLSALTGCFGMGKGETEPSTELTPPSNLVESTDPAPTETTEPEPTEPEKDNVAIVKEQTNVLQVPSKEGKVLETLDAGEEVEISRLETISAVQWAYIPLRGWVAAANLDMSKVTKFNDPNSTPANPDATEPGDTTTGETKPADTTTTTTPANGKKGIVTASELNIRSEASQNGDRLGQYTYGDRVVFTETSNGWGKTNKGWISLNYVYIDGNTGTNTAKGLVTGNGVNVRTGPGTNHDVATTAAQGTRLNILEQIKIGNTTWGCTKDGWISMDYVYVDGTNGDGQCTGTVTGDQVNVRSGPGTNFDIVGSVKSGDTVNVHAQFTFGTTKWGCIDSGWISMDYVSAN